jgi:acyl-coenzyme A synthetase/AMP-(fatty) acid ligase
VSNANTEALDVTVPEPEPRGYPGNLGTPFTAHADSTRTAIVDLYFPDNPREVSYRTLDAMCNAVARGLAKVGLKPGDRIGILALNRVEFVATLLGAMRAGVVPVPVNVKLNVATIAFILQDAGANSCLLNRRCASCARPNCVRSCLEATARIFRAIPGSRRFRSI